MVEAGATRLLAYRASLCLMVVVWYALATVLEGALYAAVGGKGETPNWVTYVGSGVPLY